MAGLTKDMIIKLHLPASQLDSLLELCQSVGIPLTKIFELFIKDLSSDSEDGSAVLEEWLSLYASRQQESEAHEWNKSVSFSDSQVKMMQLVDLIMDDETSDPA